MAQERIEVGYRNIGTMGGVAYHHKFLLYTDSAGHQRTISGWTDDANTTEALPFGNIRVLADVPYDANNPDSPLRHPGQQQHRETIAEGADLSATWAAMIENANSKDNRFPYDPIRQNSNTLAERRGLPWDAGLQNTVLALAVGAREQGLTGITHLKVEQGQIRFAQHDGVSIREGQIDARAAANTDGAESLAHLAAHDQRATALEQAPAAPQPSDARSHAAPVLSV